jgi:ABC-type oligopeptide transport system substrate-binding subunit
MLRMSLLAYRCSLMILLAAFVLGSVAAAGNENSTPTGPELKRDHSVNVYRAPLLNNPRTLDPASVKDIYGGLVVHQLFDRLVRFSRDLLVIPSLAESWRVEDGGTTYRFLLRENARFHDGSPVTSKDVVFSLARLFKIQPAPTLLPSLLRIQGAREFMDGKASSVVGLQALDQRNLMIRLEKPYVPFLAALGMHNASIVPEAAVRGDAEFWRHPTGSGPFRLASWEENRRVRLERFPGYYGGASRLDGIDFLIYPGIDVERVWSDFQKGGLEEMPVYPQFRDKLKSIQNLVWVHRPSLSLQFYGFNTNHPMLKDVQLRAKLAQAIDRVRLASEVYGNQLEPAVGILPPGLPGYVPKDMKSPPIKQSQTVGSGFSSQEDPARGKTQPIEIVSNSQSILAQSELQFVKESWGELGIEMEAKYVRDWEQFERYLRSDDMQVYRYAWFADMPDPDDFLRALFASDSPVNFMRYNNAKVDEMLQDALGIQDPIERARQYSAIEAEILKDSPAVPLVYLSVDIVYQPYVRDIEVTALGSRAVSYHRVWLDRTGRP